METLALGQSWQTSVLLNCEGCSLCYSVAALEVCTVNEKGKADVILVTYLLIVPPPPPAPDFT